MAFSLGSLGKTLGSLIGGGENSVLGIDIGASSAKIVQLRAAHGAAILETYGEIALAPYAELTVGKAVKLQPEKTAEALQDLMREANVTARSGGISIPFALQIGHRCHRMFLLVPHTARPVRPMMECVFVDPSYLPSSSPWAIDREP